MENFEEMKILKGIFEVKRKFDEVLKVLGQIWENFKETRTRMKRQLVKIKWRISSHVLLQSYSTQGTENF